MGIVEIRSLGYYNVTKSIISFDKRGKNRIPPPYKVPNFHPRNYYKTDQLKESENSEGNVQTKMKLKKIPILVKTQMTPRKFMSDEPILEKYIDLSALDLSSKEKDTLMSIWSIHTLVSEIQDKMDLIHWCHQIGLWSIRRLIRITQFTHNLLE